MNLVVENADNSSKTLTYKQVFIGKDGTTTYLNPENARDVLVIHPDGTSTRFYSDGKNQFEASIGKNGKQETKLIINRESLNHGDLIAKDPGGQLTVIHQGELAKYIKDNGIQKAYLSINGKDNTGSSAVSMYKTFDAAVEHYRPRSVTFHLFNDMNVSTAEDRGPKDDTVAGVNANRIKPSVVNSLAQMILAGGFDKGGLIISHSAGAANMEAGVALVDKPLGQTPVVTFGGAHGKVLNNHVKTWADFYNDGDVVRQFGKGRTLKSDPVLENPNKNNYYLHENDGNNWKGKDSDPSGLHHNFGTAYLNALEKCLSGESEGCQ